MSAIKKFFEKKKTDAKFKLAGGGQKLGDANDANAAAQRAAAAAAASSSSGKARAGSSSGSRGQLSGGQRLAASAALERYVSNV